MFRPGWDTSAFGIVADGYTHSSVGRPPSGSPLPPSAFETDGRARDDTLFYSREWRDPARATPFGLRFSGGSGALDLTSLELELDVLQATALSDDEGSDSDGPSTATSARTKRAAAAKAARDNARGNLASGRLIHSGREHAVSTSPSARCVGCRANILRSCSGVSVCCRSCTQGPADVVTRCVECDLLFHVTHHSHERILFVSEACSAELGAGALVLSGQRLHSNEFVVLDGALAQPAPSDDAPLGQIVGGCASSDGGISLLVASDDDEQWCDRAVFLALAAQQLAAFEEQLLDVTRGLGYKALSRDSPRLPARDESLFASDASAAATLAAERGVALGSSCMKIHAHLSSVASGPSLIVSINGDTRDELPRGVVRLTDPAALLAYERTLMASTRGLGYFATHSLAPAPPSSPSRIHIVEIPVALPVSVSDTCGACHSSGRWRIDAPLLWGLRDQFSAQRIILLTMRESVQVTVPPVSSVVCGGSHVCEVVSCDDVGLHDCPAHSTPCNAPLPRAVSPVDDLDCRRYFPSTSVDVRLIFDTAVFDYWQAQVAAHPGTSTEGFSRFLSLVHRASSDEGRREPDLPRPQSLAEAFHNWGRVMEIDSILRGLEPHTCPSCGVHDAAVDKYLVVHIDGNMKLFSFGGGSKDAKHELDYMSQFHIADDTVSRHWDSLHAHQHGSGSGADKEGAAASACGNDFTALKGSKFDRLRESGAMFGTCAHCHVICWANIFGGEKYKFGAGLLAHGSRMRGKGPSTVAYDIGCAFGPSMERRNRAAVARPPFASAAVDDDGNSTLCSCFAADGTATGEFVGSIEHETMLGMMHMKAHRLSCQLRYDPRLLRGLGHATGETSEQVFSSFSREGNGVKNMRDDRRVAYLDRAIRLYNLSKQEAAPSVLYQQLSLAISRVDRTQRDLEETLARINAIAPPSTPYSVNVADQLAVKQAAAFGLGRRSPTEESSASSGSSLLSDARGKSQLLRQLLEIDAKIAFSNALNSSLAQLKVQYCRLVQGAATSAFDAMMLRAVAARHGGVLANLAALQVEMPSLVSRRSAIRGSLMALHHVPEDQIAASAGASVADGQLDELVRDMSRLVQQSGSLRPLLKRDHGRSANPGINARATFQTVQKKLASALASARSFLPFASPSISGTPLPSEKELLEMDRVEQLAAALTPRAPAAAVPHAAAGAPFAHLAAAGVPFAPTAPHAAAGAPFVPLAAAGMPFAPAAPLAALGGPFALAAPLAAAIAPPSLLASSVLAGLEMELVRARTAELSAKEELANIVRALQHNVSYYERDRTGFLRAGMAALDVAPPGGPVTGAPFTPGDVASRYAAEPDPSRLVRDALATASLRPPVGLASQQASALSRAGLRLALRAGQRRAARLATTARAHTMSAGAILHQQLRASADPVLLDGLARSRLSVLPASVELRKQHLDPVRRMNARALVEKLHEHASLANAFSPDVTGDAIAGMMGLSLSTTELA